MDVVLNNSAFPGNSSPLSEVKSGAKEVTKESSRSSSASAAVSTAEVISLSVSSQAKDTVELASQTESAGQNNKTEEKKEDQEKTVSNTKEKNIVVNETLLKYRIEESENKETGKTSKELVVYLMDKNSGKVIRQLPPKDFFDQSNNKELPSSGIFINQEG